VVNLDNLLSGDLRTITNSQIFPPNYNIYRKDRKGNKTGGGVLIAINDKYLSSEIPELDTDCEIIWCKIQQKGNKDLYICSYGSVPPW
jgi:hypothetical protein